MLRAEVRDRQVNIVRFFYSFPTLSETVILYRFKV
jgi:hypothetical protein